MATLILTPLISAPQVLGVLFWNDFETTVLQCTLGGSIVFVATYLAGIRVAKRGRITIA